MNDLLLSAWVTQSHMMFLQPDGTRILLKIWKQWLSFVLNNLFLMPSNISKYVTNETETSTAL